MLHAEQNVLRFKPKGAVRAKLTLLLHVPSIYPWWTLEYLGYIGNTPKAHSGDFIVLLHRSKAVRADFTVLLNPFTTLGDGFGQAHSSRGRAWDNSGPFK